MTVGSAAAPAHKQSVVRAGVNPGPAFGEARSFDDLDTIGEGVSVPTA
jgi:hypothetical protein